MALKQTPLHEKHIALNAKMVPFGGWDMPLQYDSILSEYEETRHRAAIFDISHMGEFIIEGDAVESGLNRIVTQRIENMPIKSCRYGAVLNENGGVIDDLIIFRMAQKKWMAVVNGATTEKDARHFIENISDKRIFENFSDRIGKLDIQGPLSREMLTSLIPKIAQLEYYTFDEFSVLGEKAIVSRTGYTGELGYEIYFPWNKTEELWGEILKRNVKPAGLGARDILRIEMGYSLYGHELEESISPLESGLERFIDWEKDFIGKEALQKEEKAGVQRKVVCFVSNTRQAPRTQHKIFSESNEEIGVVTSGTFSPGLAKGVGLGFIRKDAYSFGKKILFGNEKNKISAEIAGRPVYKKGSLKQ